MTVTYIHHSGFLVESRKFYYLFDYESGNLPELNPEKPIFVLSSHSHGDHYNPAIFSRLPVMQVRAVLSGDISAPQGIDTLSVDPNREYSLGPGQRLTTFRSTDLGVAFLLEEEDGLLYHAGDLNDWVWEGEPDAYNEEMTRNYRKEIAVGSVLRIVFAPLLGIGVAVLLGCFTGLKFGQDAYPALIALFGAPAAVSGPVMASQMGGDAQLATQIVVWTSIGSIFTIFATACILMSVGLLPV